MYSYKLLFFTQFQQLSVNFVCVFGFSTRPCEYLSQDKSAHGSWKEELRGASEALLAQQYSFVTKRIHRIHLNLRKLRESGMLVLLH